MGLGDDILATGQAIKRGLKAGGVVFGRSRDMPRKSSMYDHVAWINCPGAQHFVQEYGGKRAYYDYQRSNGKRVVLHEDYRPYPGELNIEPELKEIRDLLPKRDERPVVAIHTEVKRMFSGDNRMWPWAHWQELAGELLRAGYHVWQIDPPGVEQVHPDVPHFRFGLGETYKLRNKYLERYGLRKALAALSQVDLVVCPEDIMHHAAAALGVQAVVLYGGRTNPLLLGYPTQRNITTDEEWCGMRVPCDHCKRAMRSITPDRVMAEVVEALDSD